MFKCFCFVNFTFFMALILGCKHGNIISERTIINRDRYVDNIGLDINSKTDGLQLKCTLMKNGKEFYNITNYKTTLRNISGNIKIVFCFVNNYSDSIFMRHRENPISIICHTEIPDGNFLIKGPPPFLEEGQYAKIAQMGKSNKFVETINVPENKTINLIYYTQVEYYICSENATVFATERIEILIDNRKNKDKAGSKETSLSNKEIKLD